MWRDGSQRNKKATAAEVAALDRSGAHGDAAAQQAAQDRHLEEMRGTYLANEGEKAAWDEEEELLLEDESDDEAAPKSWFGPFGPIRICTASSRCGAVALAPPSAALSLPDGVDATSSPTCLDHIPSIAHFFPFLH